MMFFPALRLKRVSFRKALFAVFITALCWFLLRHLSAKTAIQAWMKRVHPDISKLNLANDQPYDRWAPPYEWQGTVPVYDNFPSLNHKYAFGSKSLSRMPSTWSRAPEAFPLYRAHARNDSIVACSHHHIATYKEHSDGRICRFLGKLRDPPVPAFGSNEEVGFDGNMCYERGGRHGAFGLWHVAGSDQDKLWDDVDWSQRQRNCFARNSGRFVLPTPVSSHTSYDQRSGNGVARTAILLRAHQHTEYTEELKRNIRSIITELALYTSAEFAVFLLVEVKDQVDDIWIRQGSYEAAVERVVPQEFRSIAVLWNEQKWREEYPLIPQAALGIHLSQWLPVQYFRHLYPGFAHYWNWEMDVRFTGHHYSLVKTVSDFARAQPRKGLWERNARLYSAQIHGSFQEFRDLIQSRYTADGRDHSTWGPQLVNSEKSHFRSVWLSKLDTCPPVPRPELDNYTWGVGEEADLITFLPLFNPTSTNYVWRDMYMNYEDYSDQDKPLRRATIITFSRLSSRLLQLMDAENRTPPGHHMSSELWPHSLSLQYGLKAVSVPHAIYLEQAWPSEALDFVFNNGDQNPQIVDRERSDRFGEGSGGPESVFGWEREHNWDRSTWYYRNRMAERLYKRWLGWEVDGIGGPVYEAKHGNYCLPPMLLHPIKNVKDPPQPLSAAPKAQD